MKIAIFSDIHGNVFALKKCIEYIEKINIEDIIFCGDYISDIPKSHDVISYLKELNKKYNCYFVRGNREEYIIDYLNNDRKDWAMDNRNGPMLCTLNDLNESDINFIKKLPDSLEININGLLPICVNHKRVDNIKKHRYLIYGHTHRPEYFNNQGIYYINPGSVGLGLSNGFCAEFAILDVENKQGNLEFINIKYEVEEIIKSIKDSELSNTKIRWDQILIKTIEDGIDYSELYIKKVLENAKKIGINNIDDISINLWDETRREIFK